MINILLTVYGHVPYYSLGFATRFYFTEAMVMYVERTQVQLEGIGIENGPRVCSQAEGQLSACDGTDKRLLLIYQ
jgi:hypothetical protein